MAEQDPFASIAKPIDDPFASIAKPIQEPTIDSRNALQKSFDENTATNPKEPLLETGLKSVVGAIGSPFVHPLNTAKGIAQAVMPDKGGKGIAEAAFGPAGPAIAHLGSGLASGAKADYKEGGLPYAATKTAGSAFGNAALGVAGGGGISALDEVIPQTGRAIAKFESLNQDLANHPVPLKQTIQPLQRVTELGARGGTLPKAASDLLTRSQGIEPMSYPEARDYQSNLTDLSREAKNSMNSKMKGGIGKLNQGIYGDIYDAADTVGRGEDYASAMSEFRNAARIKDLIKKSAIPLATGAVAGPKIARFLKDQ